MSPEEEQQEVREFLDFYAHKVLTRMEKGRFEGIYTSLSAFLSQTIDDLQSEKERALEVLRAGIQDLAKQNTYEGEAKLVYDTTMKEVLALFPPTRTKQTHEPMDTNEVPMGVSQWRNHGEQYGYAEFFAKDTVRRIGEIAERSKGVTCTDSTHMAFNERYEAGYNQALSDLITKINQEFNLT